MNKLIYVAIAITIVFMLTYDPKSGTLDKYLAKPEQKDRCQDDVYRGNNPAQCQASHYDAVQFAKATYNAPSQNGTSMGAIIRS